MTELIFDPAPPYDEKPHVDQEHRLLYVYVRAHRPDIKVVHTIDIGGVVMDLDSHRVVTGFEIFPSVHRVLGTIDPFPIPSDTHTMTVRNDDQQDDGISEVYDETRRMLRIELLPSLSDSRLVRLSQQVSVWVDDSTGALAGVFIEECDF